jgi:hypothetical protein
MNNLTRILLGGAAVCALTGTSAAAQAAPAIHFTALHGGRVVNKTRLHSPHRCLRSDSCTEYVYTSVSASDLDKKVKLIDTFYKLNSNDTLCSVPKQELKVPKKSTYGKVSAATETYSEGCASGPTTFYGDVYKLTNPEGEGKVDTFISRLKGKIQLNGNTYKETLYIIPYVTIGTE